MTDFNPAQTLTDILFPFLSPEAELEGQDTLMSPDELAQTLKACDPETGYFKFRTNSEFDNDSRRVKSDGVRSVRTSLLRLAAALGMKRTRENAGGREASGLQVGVRYSVSSFPMFDLQMPDKGLARGSGRTLHWVRPVLIELRCTQVDGFGSGDEIRSVFYLQFQDGTGGQAGFIDRIEQDRHRRFHQYPDGTLAAVDRCPERRRNHDIYRTLMGHLLLAEIYPEIYESALQTIRENRDRAQLCVDDRHPADTDPKVIHFLPPHSNLQETQRQRPGAANVFPQAAQKDTPLPAKLYRLKDFRRVV